MATRKNPFVGQNRFAYRVRGREFTVGPDVLYEFIRHLLKLRKLEIGSVFRQSVQSKPAFLIAGTGLGKTLVMPVFFWYRHLFEYQGIPADELIGADRSPRVWVIEPRVAIVQALCAKMNEEWSDWQRKIGGTIGNVFGSKTKVDAENPGAPVTFITTGMFGNYARAGMFRPGHDVIVFDEAHKTLEADESVELGIGLCRMNGVPIEYMSATVDPEGLEEQLGATTLRIEGKRYPVWRHNMGRRIDDCIVELVEQTLVRPKLDSPYFPKPTGEVERGIIASVCERNRAKGMLVMINSFSDDRSDARRIERLLRESEYADAFEIGLLASEVRRDPARRAEYEAMIARWARERKRYVLIATSVVEMGVTLPDLDFVVSMDSEYDERAEGRPRKRPLRMNTLIQRAGRVGRLRPGIAYFTRDIGAPFSEWDDAKFNDPASIAPEPVQFPMASSPLTQLAYETLRLSWGDDVLVKRLADLKLPTDIAGNPERLRVLCRERFRLWGLGVGWGADTSVGRRLGAWIDRMDLNCAIKAHAAFDAGDIEGTVRALCEGVITESPFDRDDTSDLVFRSTDESVTDMTLMSMFVRWIVKTPDFSARHHRVHERVHDMLSDYVDNLDIDEISFIRAIFRLSEFIENFLKIVRAERGNVDNARIGGLTRWQKAISAYCTLVS